MHFAVTCFQLSVIKGLLSGTCKNRAFKFGSRKTVCVVVLHRSVRTEEKRSKPDKKPPKPKEENHNSFSPLISEYRKIRKIRQNFFPCQTLEDEMLDMTWECAFLAWKANSTWFASKVWLAGWGKWFYPPPPLWDPTCSAPFSFVTPSIRRMCGPAGVRPGSA